MLVAALDSYSPYLENTWKYLKEKSIEALEQPLQRSVKKAFKKFPRWDEKLFRRVTLGLRVVVWLRRQAAIRYVNSLPSGLGGF